MARKIAFMQTWHSARQDAWNSNITASSNPAQETLSRPSAGQETG
jgi:hypothetical protein